MWALSKNTFQLLDVDNCTILPYKFLSSTDVLHAWTVPSLGVKADAVPGRLNWVKFIAQHAGIFLCSEICGANHRFVPFVLKIVRPTPFDNWAHISQDWRYIYIYIFLKSIS